MGEKLLLLQLWEKLRLNYGVKNAPRRAEISCSYVWKSSTIRPFFTGLSPALLLRVAILAVQVTVEKASTARLLRMKFTREYVSSGGLVATANTGNNDNESQFFFTLGACPELQNKHTIFGKVGGDTLFNMIKFNDLDCDREDRPCHPPKILR